MNKDINVIRQFVVNLIRNKEQQIVGWYTIL